jgi:hypothetical protein
MAWIALTLAPFTRVYRALPGVPDLANTCIHYACPTCLGEEGWEATHACQHLLLSPVLHSFIDFKTGETSETKAEVAGFTAVSPAFGSGTAWDARTGACFAGSPAILCRAAYRAFSANCCR